MKTFGQTKMVRKMSFLSDQEGIMTRYLREKKNWQPHLDNTKRFILDSFKNEKVKTLAVLGSGWLLDLPLEELSEKYEKVLLLDVYHPMQIQKKISGLKNVEAIETDITGGGIEFCWELRKKKKEHLSKYTLDEFKPKKPALPFKPDAFISLNILNQLDILLVDFIEQKNGRFTDSEIKRFRKSIQEFHINWITKVPGCLISDIKEVNADKKGQKTTKDLLFVKLPGSQRSESWVWDFDLSGKYHEDMQTRMEVSAIEW